MMASDEPMSDARLAEIRETAQQAGWMYAESDNEAYGLYRPIEELLAEVERLRAREAALVAVVEKVWTLAVQSAYDDKWFIPHVHAAHELVNQARALLAATEPTDATTAERE